MASKQWIARSSLSYMGMYLERTGLYISFSHSMLREIMLIASVGHGRSIYTMETGKPGLVDLFAYS